MKAVVLIVFLVLISCSRVWAQLPDSTDAEINLLIEDAMTTSDNQNSEQDWTQVTDYLNDLRRRPLNLNTANRAELAPIPGFSEMLINNLFKYIQNYGRLTSLYELQAVEGFTPEVFSKIGPFITVDEFSKLDINNKNQHPAGPGIPELIKGMQYEIMQRYSTILEDQKGYTPADTNSRGQLNDRYLGSPWRSFTRFRARYGQNFSVCLVGEKDAGEKFEWNPNTQTYGYDFVAGHIAIRNYKNLKALALGNYTVQFGQGLVISGGLGFGKGAEVINSIKRPNYGIRPYTSINEFNGLQGGAATYAIGKVYVTGFASNRKMDASLVTVTTNVDSSGNQEDILISSLNQSGLHRTADELSKKNNITEQTMGGRIEWQSRSIVLGTTHMVQEFSNDLRRGTRTYQQFDFEGRQNMVSGIDFDWVVRNMNIFGEAAQSKSGGIGVMGGVLAALDPKMDVALHFRHFDKDFHTLRGFGFAERPFQPANETGVYTGIRIRPVKRWTFSTYFDKYYFPWYLSSATFSSGGQDWLGQLNYNPNKKTEVYVRFRTESKDRNASVRPEGQVLNFQVPFRRDNLRVNFRTQVAKEIRLSSRVEYSWYDETNAVSSSGVMIYQDISWDVARRMDITMRYSIFDTKDNNTRIYVFENDVPTFYSIPSFSGKGDRYYVMVRLTPIKHFDIWLRYSNTTFRGRATVGSGLEESQGPIRSDFRIQARYTF